MKRNRNHDTWKTLSDINFPTQWANGDKMSAFDRKMSADLVNFRVGPSRMFQFRETKRNYQQSWNEIKYDEIRPWEKDSPLKSPWFYNSETFIPDDWIPKVIIRAFRAGQIGCP